MATDTHARRRRALASIQKRVATAESKTMNLYEMRRGLIREASSEGMSLSDIARALGLARSTVQKLARPEGAVRNGK